MLTQQNCFDNALHILLKQNMDKTVRKAANFLSFKLYQTWSSSDRDLQSYRMVTFKHRSMNWS